MVVARRMRMRMRRRRRLHPRVCRGGGGEVQEVAGLDAGEKDGGGVERRAGLVAPWAGRVREVRWARLDVRDKDGDGVCGPGG